LSNSVDLGRAVTDRSLAISSSSSSSSSSMPLLSWSSA
jgi:hypothetical protein